MSILGSFLGPTGSLYYRQVHIVLSVIQEQLSLTLCLQTWTQFSLVLIFVGNIGSILTEITVIANPFMLSRTNYVTPIPTADAFKDVMTQSGANPVCS